MGISLGKIGYIQSPAEATATKFFGGPSGALVSPEFENKVKQIIGTQKRNTTSGGGGGSAGKSNNETAADNDVNVNIDYKMEPWDWKDWAGLFFPPINLMNQGNMPPGTIIPDFNMTGPPGFFQQQGPIAPAADEDLFGLGKTTKQFGSLIKIAIPLLLIGFAASTLKSFKGLFS